MYFNLGSVSFQPTSTVHVITEKWLSCKSFDTKSIGIKLFVFDYYNLIICSARLFVNMVGGVSRLPYMMPEDIKLKEEPKADYNVSTPTKISLIQLQEESLEIKSQKVSDIRRKASQWLLMYGMLCVALYIPSL